jgi:hypothetical protein
VRTTNIKQLFAPLKKSRIFLIKIDFFFSFSFSFYFSLFYYFFISKNMPRFIGSIDQGTTSTRFVIFDESGSIVTLHQMEFEQNYPQPG